VHTTLRLDVDRTVAYWEPDDVHTALRFDVQRIFAQQEPDGMHTLRRRQNRRNRQNWRKQKQDKVHTTLNLDRRVTATKWRANDTS